MSTLDIQLPAGYYKLGGLNEDGIHVYHNGRDRFTADIGPQKKFDRVNENVDPYSPFFSFINGKKEKKELLGNANLTRTSLSGRRNVPSAGPSLAVNTNLGTPPPTLSVYVTPLWRTPILSPGSPSTAYLIQVQEIPTRPSTPKAFRAIDIEAIPFWTSVPNTPMTPEEQATFFAPSNSPMATRTPDHFPTVSSPLFPPLRSPLTPTRAMSRAAPYPNRRTSMPASMDEFGAGDSNGPSSSTGPTRGSRKSKTAPRSMRF